MPSRVVSHTPTSAFGFCNVLDKGRGVLLADSAIALIRSISPTLMLRRLIWFEGFSGSVSSLPLGTEKRDLIFKGDCCSMSTRDSSLGVCDIEGCIGGNGFVVFEVPRRVVKMSAIGEFPLAGKMS